MENLYDRSCSVPQKTRFLGVSRPEDRSHPCVAMLPWPRMRPCGRSGTRQKRSIGVPRAHAGANQARVNLFIAFTVRDPCAFSRQQDLTGGVATEGPRDGCPEKFCSSGGPVHTHSQGICPDKRKRCGTGLRQTIPLFCPSPISRSQESISGKRMHAIRSGKYRLFRQVS